MPSSELAASIRGLGKSYRIVHNLVEHITLAEALLHRLRHPFRRIESETFWALRDVSLDVKRGEVVGIIGRNGAGKSTLLKILSRITEPTEGIVDLYGRTGSLLEVGTGFHKELTGRENIYLNGSILGMKRREIDRHFDAIVEFSGVEKFLDTPVKRYSSGMYVRLAFAVAAHLDPEILIVDEVLAVGDMAFQKKCLGKMQDVAGEGRTVLFISHNMPTVAKLCSRAILLEQGRLTMDGPPQQVIERYLESGAQTLAHRRWDSLRASPGNEVVRLRRVQVSTDEGPVEDTVDIRSEVRIEAEYDVLTPGYHLVPNFHLYNEEGTCILITIDNDPAWRRKPRPEGRYTSSVRIPGNFFAEGLVAVKASITTPKPEKVHVSEPHVVAFHVYDDHAGDTARGDYDRPLPGVVRPLLPWKTQTQHRAEDQISSPQTIPSAIG